MAYTLSAGSLDHQVTIQQRTVARDATYGSETVAWSDLATVWARVVESSTAPSSGRGQAERVDAYVRPTKVYIRWRADVDTTMRLVHNGQLLKIDGTAELNRRQWLEMACAEWSHE
jgi:SPP1 family predicted phage head-tail adaptor